MTQATDHPLSPSNRHVTTSEQPRTPTLYDSFGGRLVVPTNDPAWQAPRDPLSGGVATVINREIPITTIQTSFSVADVTGSISQLLIGLFDQPSQLCDNIMADSRATAALGSRVGGVFGRPARFSIPKRFRGSKIARECRDAWASSWPQMNPTATLTELHRWGVMLGFWLGQTLWDHSGKYSIPHLETFHARYTYYHWILRCFVAITQDGQVPVTPGDGHWVLHAPYGAHRGWTRAAMWSIAPWWLGRNFSLRDQMRYNERHGLAIVKAKSPAAANKDIVKAWLGSFENFGQEAVFHCPQGVDAQNSYDVELLEASDQAFLTFKTTQDTCSGEIVLALLWQNLMTEVKEGSFAAARMHGDVRETCVEMDEHGISQTVYAQMARPFALMNFGDADLAPFTHWPVRPEEDQKTRSETLASFSKSLSDLRTAGIKMKPRGIRKLARSLGLSMGEFEMVDPTQIASSLAKTTGKDVKGDVLGWQSFSSRRWPRGRARRTSCTRRGSRRTWSRGHAWRRSVSAGSASTECARTRARSSSPPARCSPAPPESRVLSPVVIRGRACIVLRRSHDEARSNTKATLPG